MVEEDLGEATIAYEDPDEGTVERTVENEHVAYFQDHWILKTGENERGEDVVRRIPVQRVHYVERSVEEFQEEVSTVRDQVQSFADDLRSRLLGGGETGREREPEEVYHIDVEGGRGGTETADEELTGAEPADEELTGTETADEELTEADADEADEPDGPGS